MSVRGLLVATMLVTVLGGCATVSAPVASGTPRPVARHQSAREVSLKLTDLPAGFRMSFDGPTTLHQVIGDDAETHDLLIASGFLSVHQRIFWLPETKEHPAREVTALVLLFRDSDGARVSMLTFAERMLATGNVVEQRLPKRIADEVRLMRTDYLEGDQPVTYLTVALRHQNASSFIGGQFRTGDEDMALMLALAGRILEYQLAETGQLKMGTVRIPTCADPREDCGPVGDGAMIKLGLVRRD